MARVVHAAPTVGRTSQIASRTDLPAKGFRVEGLEWLPERGSKTCAPSLCFWWLCGPVGGAGAGQGRGWGSASQRLGAGRGGRGTPASTDVPAHIAKQLNRVIFLPFIKLCTL